MEAAQPHADGRSSGRIRDLLHGNVLWLSIISLVNDIATEMTYPLLAVFLVSLGAGPAFIGLVEGVAEATSSFLKLISGRISDRVRGRKALAGWGYGLACFVRPFIALATAPWHVLALRFTDRIGKGLRTAPRDALLAESVPEQRRGTAFGIHSAADNAGAVIGPLIATLLLLAWPGHLRLVFALAAIPSALVILLFITRVRDTAHTAIPTAAPGAPVSWRGLGPAFPRYLGVLMLFTLGNATDAFLLLRAQSLGIAVAFLPILWALLNISKTAWNIPGGALADRFGPRGSISAGWLVYAAVYSGFAFANVQWHIWALFAVYGLFYGLTEAPEKALVASLAPPHLRGSAFGAFAFAIGVVALPASLLFGLLWQHYGPATAFLTGASIALVSALLLPLVVPRRATPAPAVP